MAARLGEGVRLVRRVPVDDKLVDADRFGHLGQVAAHGDDQLQRGDVAARDALGDGVLDLQARVELEKVELTRLLDEEILDRPRVRVVHHQREPRRRELHLPHRLRRHRDRRPLLHDLLEAALHRAVASGED